MPTEPLRIKGQFFNLRTGFSVSPTKGYKPLSREVFRMPADTGSLDATVPLNKDLNCLKEVTDNLGYKVALLEINFNSISVINGEDVTVQPVVLHPLTLAKKAQISSNAMASAIRVYPVIATKKREMEVSLVILEEYIKVLDSIKEKLLGAQFIAITGEMVWSGWINKSMMAYLLSNIAIETNYWAIDEYGVWEVIAHSTIDDRLIRSLSKLYLAPNIFSYRPAKTFKQITIENQGEKRVLMIDGKARLIDKIGGWQFGNIMLPEYLVIKGEEANLQIEQNDSLYVKQNQFVPSLIRGEVGFYDDEIQIDLKQGTRVKFGDFIGIYDRKTYKVIKLKEFSKELKFKVSHGQRVEKGEVIATNETLMGKVFNEQFISPINGIVDLSHKEDDLLFIWNLDEGKDELLSLFNGLYISGKNGKYHQFDVNYFEIPAELMLGPATSGVLTTGTGEVTSKGKKVLLIDSLENFYLNAETLINSGTEGIIFGRSTYEEMNKAIEENAELFDLLTISFLDSFSGDYNKYYWDLLHKADGRMVTLDKGRIKVIMDNLPDNQYKEIKLISYTENFRYYREIKKNPLNKYLLTNDKQIVEGSICNLLF